MDIFIIDDEPDICTLVSTIVKQKGFDVDFANDLKSGFEKIKKKNPQLLFLDLNLPDGSGYSIINQVKEFNPQIKICIISAYNTPTEQQSANEYPIDKFIGKPFGKKQILDLIENLEIKPSNKY